MKEQEVEGTYFDLGMVSEEYKIEVYRRHCHVAACIDYFSLINSLLERITFCKGISLKISYRIKK